MMKTIMKLFVLLLALLPSVGVGMDNDNEAITYESIFLHSKGLNNGNSFYQLSDSGTAYCFVKVIHNTPRSGEKTKTSVEIIRFARPIESPDVTVTLVEGESDLEFALVTDEGITTYRGPKASCTSDNEIAMAAAAGYELLRQNCALVANKEDSFGGIDLSSTFAFNFVSKTEDVKPYPSYEYKMAISVENADIIDEELTQNGSVVCGIKRQENRQGESSGDFLLFQDSNEKAVQVIYRLDQGIAEILFGSQHKSIFTEDVKIKPLRIVGLQKFKHNPREVIRRCAAVAWEFLQNPNRTDWDPLITFEGQPNSPQASKSWVLNFLKNKKIMIPAVMITIAAAAYGLYRWLDKQKQEAIEEDEASFLTE